MVDEKKQVKGVGREKETEAGKGKTRIVLMVRDETNIILKEAQRGTKKCW